MAEAHDEQDVVSVRIFDHHRPTLDSGDYTLWVEPLIRNPDTGLPLLEVMEQKFSVLGPRFKLSPQDVHAIFPPQGSKGPYQDVLPHVVLKRSTLPWERSPDNIKRDSNEERHPPWLALLLVDEDEQKTHFRPADKDGTAAGPTTIKLKDLKQPGDVSFPVLKLESGDHEDDELTVIDVDRDFLAGVVPAAGELHLLAHVRQQVADCGKSEDEAEEFAVVVGNRLPSPEKCNIVYLVSIEGRYKGDALDADPPRPWVRLVVLKTWQFTCHEAEGLGFKELLEGLNQKELALPPAGNVHADPYLETGFVPLRHHKAAGQETVSWYRGPLVSGLLSDTGEWPLNPTSADQLVRHNPALGMDDVSYAAAWELGHLLTLQNSQAAMALYNWKRQCHQQACHEACCDEVAHLPCQMTDCGCEFPHDWFCQLTRLEGIPFNYLVPDERMLPSESIRFFRVDPGWVRSLLDGAFSIGAHSSHDCNDFAEQKQWELGDEPPPMSGFLLRSDLVSGWPGMQMTAYAADGAKLASVGDFRHLSQNVLLGLFKGVLEKLDIYLPQHALHFTVEDAGENRKAKFVDVQSSSDLAYKRLEHMVKVRFTKAP